MHTFEPLVFHTCIRSSIILSVESTLVLGTPQGSFVVVLEGEKPKLTHGFGLWFV
jgi:hypothetical protein